MAETGSTKTPRRRLKSLLSSPLKRLLAFVVGVGVFMLANTLYLVSNRLADVAGWTWITGGVDSLPAIFQSMVLAHTGAGLILAVVATVFVVWHLKAVWARQHATSIVSGVTVVVAGGALVYTGLLILTASASESNRWAWWTHVLVALLIPGGYAIHRFVSFTRPADGLARKYTLAVVGLTAILMIGHGFSAGVTLTPEAESAMEAGLQNGPSGEHRDVPALIGEAFVPQGLVPPQSIFFPSPATTGTGDRIPRRIIVPEIATLDSMAIAAEVTAFGFATETLIGAETCVRCHADVTEQWAASAHRFSSFNNPFYEATVNAVRQNRASDDRWVNQHLETFGIPSDGVGVVQSRWCGACHDPALLFTGVMDGEIDRRRVQAQAGLTCTACHQIDATHDRTGNGNYNVQNFREDPYLFNEAPPGSTGEILHDAALKAKPLVHKREFLKPFFSDASYCSACHKVSITEPLNGYRWIRGQNEFDNWDDSGVALNASRTFYLPSDKRVCQDCHMPPEAAPLGDVSARNGSVRSHRFLAANTALPYLRGDTATIRRIGEFLSSEKLSVDIFALRRGNNPETVMDMAGALPPLRVGERVRLDVVVRNRGVGHTFPGGTNDSNQAWLEFTLLDGDGSVLARSGALDEEGYLDPNTHKFGAVLLDGEGNAIHDRNGARIQVTAAVNVIGPGTSDLAQYAFTVPETLAGRRLTVEARLLYRKFDRKYTDFAFAQNPEGFAAFDAPPDLPVTEIATDRIELSVREDAAEGLGTTPRANGARSPTGWQRFNDYGIALLLEGNTREARAVFEWVARDDAGAFEGHLNLARLALRDGNLQAAFDHLDQVENVRPGDARAAWVWANVLQEDGDFERAVQAYELVLEHFPGDRAAWRNLGRTHYLAQQYDKAISAFARVLEIDPEDRVAHYHTMLSLRALGRDTEAALAEAAYERYRLDESAQSLTREFREQNPAVNLMSQPIHTHDLIIGR
jgi:tetratricopeptide (TPR) repeat protein